MKLELISSDRCPFVQRSIVTLEQKQVPYQITYVDPYDPPDWFAQVSPLGKVPVLKVDDDTVLFESAVINEYLDDVTPGQLHPEDPLQRALNKSWIEFGGGCLSNTFQLLTVPTKVEYEATCQQLRQSLERLEDVCTGPFFNGSSFALIDAAYAPLFVRLELLQELQGLNLTDDLPTIREWKNALLTLPSVQVTKTPILKTRLLELMQDKNAWGQTLLADKMLS